MANKLLYNQAEIRRFLYQRIAELQNWKAQHIEAFADRHEDSDAYGSIKPCGDCHVCQHLDGEIDGLKFAIRHLGGRPRYA